MALPIKTRDEILRGLRTDIEGFNTKLNVGDHSVPYDISLFPASTLGEDLWLLADFTVRVRSTSDIIAMLDDANYKEKLRILFSYDTITQVESLISSLLDALVGNWNVIRNAARKARVPVRFYATSNIAVTIPAESRVSTRGQNPVTFLVLGGTNAATPIYESTKGLYYVELICEAEVAGADSNVGVDNITVLVDNITGIVQCSNPTTPYVEGTDQESDQDLATRSTAAWVAWSLDTVGGIEGFFNGQPNVDDVYVAKPGDVLIGRNPRGAPVDIFVEAPVDPVVNVDAFLTAASIPVSIADKIMLNDMFSLSNAKTSSPTQITPIGGVVTTSTTLTYYPNLQPVVLIQNVSGGTSGNISFTEYIDESHAFSGSTRSKSYVELTIDEAVAERGETITVTYTYNSTITGLQNTIDDPANDLQSQDLLVRAGKEILVNITGNVLTLAGYTNSAVEAVVELDITKLFGGGLASTGIRYSKYDLGQRIDILDILLVALSVEGVDRIDDWAVTINGVATTSVYYPQNSEYARYGSSIWL